MDIDRLAKEALERIIKQINKSAAKHLHEMKKQWGSSKNE